LEDKAAELRRLQRRFDRQHRAASPECFDQRGRHIKGACHWKVRSKSSTRTKTKIAELHRRTAAHRKSAHGETWNKILGIGVHLRSEKLNYVAWQKRFPRSVGRRAPGMFIEVGHRKAANAGGSFYDYSPWTTALSQVCICGERRKKRLSERVHRCPNCGVVAPRDRFSAYLGLYVHQVVDAETGEINDMLDVEEAQAEFLNRHDIGGHPASGIIKLRGSRHGSHPRHPRAVARQKARRNKGGDRVVRGNPAQPVPTAHAATAGAVAA